MKTKRILAIIIVLAIAALGAFRAAPGSSPPKRQKTRSGRAWARRL